MQDERRIDNRRRPTGGHVAISSLTKKDETTGRAINFSSGGMCARVDGNLTIGDVVKLRLAMEDAQIEVNSHGRIVWCEPCRDLNASHIGLQLFTEDGISNWNATNIESKLPDSLDTGSEVTLEAGGALLSGIVEHMEMPLVPGQNIVRLVVAIDLTPPPLEAQDEAELAAQVERWTVHPIRDTKQWCNRYLRPIWNVIIPVLEVMWQMAAKGARWVFYRLPERWRSAPIQGARKLKLDIFVRKTMHIGSLTINVTHKLYSKTRRRLNAPKGPFSA